MTRIRINRRAFTTGALAGSLAAGAGWAAEGEKIVMASWGGGSGDAWRKAFAQPFQAQTGIPVTINDVIDPSAQIRAQAGAPQYNAAIATYVDAVRLYQAGLIETVSPDELPRVGGIPKEFMLTAPDGKLLGMPAYFVYYGIARRTDELKPGELMSWNDLGDPKWKGRIAMTGPLYGSTYDLTMTAYASGSNERNIEPGLPLYRRIAANAMTVYNNMADMNQLLTRGEIVGGAYYSSRIWLMQKSGIQNLEMVIPKEGPLMLPYMVVIPKGTFALATAKRWLDFVSTAEPQSKVLDITGFIPLSRDAKLTADQEKQLGVSLTDLTGRLIKPDWFAIAADQQRRADLVEQITAQSR